MADKPVLEYERAVASKSPASAAAKVLNAFAFGNMAGGLAWFVSMEGMLHDDAVAGAVLVRTAVCLAIGCPLVWVAGILLRLLAARRQRSFRFEVATGFVYLWLALGASRACERVLRTFDTIRLDSEQRATLVFAIVALFAIVAGVILSPRCATGK